MCTDDHLFLKAIFTLNRETKSLDKQISSCSNENQKIELEKFRELLYNLKEHGIFYIIYYFECDIKAHNYQTGSYWSISLAGFKYHLPFIQIPKNIPSNKKNIKHIDFKLIKDMDKFEAIQIINNRLQKSIDDEEFQEFKRKFTLFLEKKIRPHIHDYEFV